MFTLKGDDSIKTKSKQLLKLKRALHPFFMISRANAQWSAYVGRKNYQLSPHWGFRNSQYNELDSL